MGEEICEYKILVGKHEGKRPFERLRHRWKDDIKIDLKKWGITCGLVLRGVGKCPMAHMTMNLRVS